MERTKFVEQGCGHRMSPEPGRGHRTIRPWCDQRGRPSRTNSGWIPPSIVFEYFAVFVPQRERVRGDGEPGPPRSTLPLVIHLVVVPRSARSGGCQGSGRALVRLRRRFELAICLLEMQEEP